MQRTGGAAPPHLHENLHRKFLFIFKLVNLLSADFIKTADPPGVEAESEVVIREAFLECVTTISA